MVKKNRIISMALSLAMVLTLAGNLSVGAAGPTISVSTQDNALSLGSGHGAVIGTDNQLYTWGNGAYGQLGYDKYGGIPKKVDTFPEDIGAIVSVAAGGDRTAVIDSNGHLYIMGHQPGTARVNIGVNTDGYKPKRVEKFVELGLKVVSMSCGHTDFHAVTEDGRVWAWGKNEGGILGLGNTTPYTEPQLVPNLYNVIAVSTGGYTSLALTKEGHVYGWGEDLSDGTTSVLLPKRIENLKDVIAVSVGKGISFAAALDKDGKVYTWGSGLSGVLGHGDTKDKPTPTLVEGLPPIKSISAGSNSVAAITTDGKLYTWGGNGNGQLGLGNYGKGTERTVPTLVESIDQVSAVSNASGFIAAVTVDGKLYTWGYAGEYGQLGLGKSFPQPTPQKVNTTGSFRSIAAGGVYSAALTDSGKVYTWGYDSYSTTGAVMDTGESRIPKELAFTNEITQLSLGGSLSANIYGCVDKDGSLYVWGYNYFGGLGKPRDPNTLIYHETQPSVFPHLQNQIKEFISGGYYGGVITKVGELYTWGSNGSGRLGIGKPPEEFKESITPVKVLLPVGTKVKKALLQNTSAAVVTEDGKLFIWGENRYGHLDPLGGAFVTQPNDITAPLLVPIEGTVVDVAVSRRRYYVLTRDGKIYHFGEANEDSISYVGISKFAELPEGVTVKKMVASGDAAGFLTTDGRLFAWGENRNGEFGDGTIAEWNTPLTVTPTQIVSTLGTLKDVEFGYQHVVALTANNEIYTWGEDYNGQLGVGGMYYWRDVPTAVNVFNKAMTASQPQSRTWNMTTSFVPTSAINVNSVTIGANKMAVTTKVFVDKPQPTPVQVIYAIYDENNTLVGINATAIQTVEANSSIDLVMDAIVGTLPENYRIKLYALDMTDKKTALMGVSHIFDKVNLPTTGVT